MKPKLQLFQGFPKEGIAFLKQLQSHNNREWFEKNKQTFKNALEAPANAFLEEMCQRLEEITTVPVRGKVFRIYRDVRFSKDKTPYNTHLRMGFSCSGQEAGCGNQPMFYFSLEADKLILGCGIHEFSKDGLLSYRAALVDEQRGKGLEMVLKTCMQKELHMEPPELQRVPSGYAKDHPRESLLRRKGLAVWSESPPSEELSTANATDFCLSRYRLMKPLYEWLKRASTGGKNG